MVAARKPEMWSDLPRPQTTQQRLAYLKSCQARFAEISQISPSTSEIRIVSDATAEAEHIHASRRAATYPLQVQQSTTFRCACCGDASNVHPHAPLLANPYSDWLVLLCERCSSCCGV